MIHLHVHNEYSLLDGVGTGEDYAKKCAELGQKAIALTNHGNVDGNIRFQNACITNNIIPIHGVEAYIVDDLTIKEKGEKRNHITILAKNSQGWENILKMLTVANIDGFYYRPRIDYELLKNHLDGTVILSACCMTFLNSEKGLLFLDYLKEINFFDFFFEVMPLKLDEQIIVNKKNTELSKKYGYKIVATNDCHYVEKNDNKVQEVLLAIQSKKKWTDKDRWKFNVDDLYLKTKNDMARSFHRQNCLDRKTYLEAIDNTEIVFELCKDFRIPEIKVELPKVVGYEKEDDEILIKKLIQEGFNKKVIEKNLNIELYKKRIYEELETIIKQGFCRYFLIVWELVNWCKNNDIMVGPGRGSAGGSLVCYLLNITEIDPIKYNLIFARFISPARIDLPDIDLDFEDRKRHLVREHLETLYGIDNVSGVSTFSSMKGRGAIRDVSRVFDIPLIDVDKAAKSIVVRSGGDFRSDYTIEDAFNTFEDGIKFKKKYPEVVDISMRLEGQVRTKGQHAAAILISNENLKDGKRASLQKGKDGKTVVNWDKKDIEHVGLMKLDVLGLNMLSVLNEAAKMVKLNHGVDIDYYNLPLDDQRCYEEFTKGNNIGCFQVCSLGLRKFCKELGIDDFNMLTHATSLFRPGTLRSGMTHEFVKRKKGQVKWKSVHPIIEELTKDTFGIILYQEQVMRFMYDLGGLGWRTCDTVRKVISKSQGDAQFQKFKGLFAEGCEKKGTLKKEDAEKLWDELSSFGSYGFNLSHAAEYSLITYWDMWMKINYSGEFLCANLSFGSSDEQKKEELIREAIRLGINVRMPKIGISDSHKWILKDNILYCPFIEIKGIGEKTASKFLELKKNIDGFFDKDIKINKKFLNILEKINSFDDIDYDDELAESIKEYFSFSFVKNKHRKFDKIKQIVKTSYPELKIQDLDSIKPDKEKFYLVSGIIDNVKFGYRQNVNKNKSDDNLGGVYGNLNGEKDFSMMIFGADIYKRKKEFVEHCSDNFLFAKIIIPNKKGAILCKDAWFEDEIMSCNLSDMNLNLIKKRRYSPAEVIDCCDCELRTECKSPVIPSKGIYNIMIIGEAPGKEENKFGKGFVGASGEKLWMELKKYKFERRHFNISNIVKCYPSKSKTPKKIHIRKCSKWVEKEIERIKPNLILALGNTCIKYFTDQDSGIMAKNGTTEWNNDIGSWICWCMHPASVIYNPENKKLFSDGIKNFANKIKIIGGFDV